MSNSSFFDTLFKDFWLNVDRSCTAEDPQSMFGDHEVFDWIVGVVRPELIIEIGSWKGHSANHMADICKVAGLDTKIVCVDTFLGGPEHWLMPGLLETLHRRNGQPTIINAFLGNTIARGNEERIFPLTVDSGTGAQILEHFGVKADLIFVDAAHAYQEVINDITNYAPILSDHGVMFGDDYQFVQVAEAVHHCAELLKVQTIVSARKWIYVNEALLRHFGMANFQLRHSFEGWVHP
jgi:predicted O-methyltransferase YrrM